MVRFRTRTRRTFLKAVLLGFFVLPLRFFATMVKARRSFLSRSRIPIEVPLPLPAGISFHDDAIVFREQANYRIFSARCTHLGCIIDRTVGETLVCPCHGSRYSFSGEVLRGPAQRNLQPLSYRIDAEKGKMFIERPS